MKSVTLRTLLSLAAIAFAAPFMAVTLIVGARATALAHGAQDDLLLLALAFGGVVASIINGFGQRTSKARRGAPRRVETSTHIGPHSSVINVNC